MLVLLSIIAASTESRAINHAGTRYLYAPTAIPLGKGAGYVSQKELIFTSVAYGVTDNVSILGGTSIPIGLWALSAGEVDALMGIDALKAGYKADHYLHIGGGVEAFAIGGEVFGIGLVNGTIGDLDTNATMGLGQGFMRGEGLGITPLVLAGQHRISDKVAVISENWFVLWDGDGFSVITAGARIIGDTLTVDLALISAASQSSFVVLPIPWLDLSWHFGS